MSKHFHYLRHRIYQPKIKCKEGGSSFYKNQKYKRLEIEKKVFFSYFISEIPKFFYMGFFRKCSMFRRSIPLKKTKRGLELVSLPHFVYDFRRKMFLLLYYIDWPNFLIWLPLILLDIGQYKYCCCLLTRL